MSKAMSRHNLQKAMIYSFGLSKALFARRVVVNMIVDDEITQRLIPPSAGDSAPALRQLALLAAEWSIECMLCHYFNPMLGTPHAVMNLPLSNLGLSAMQASITAITQSFHMLYSRLWWRNAMLSMSPMNSGLVRMNAEASASKSFFVIVYSPVPVPGSSLGIIRGSIAV
jgi:hypothetical protein